MGIIRICPKCESRNLILLYPDANIWICKDCGYKGKPIEIEERYIENYFASKQMVSRLR